MKKVVALILLFSLNAAAAEVTKFEPRPAVVEQEGNTYVGILLSEEDFRKLLQDKIDTNAKVAECDVDKKVCTQLQEQYKLSIKNLQETIQKDNTWFPSHDLYKYSLFLFSLARLYRLYNSNRSSYANYNTSQKT